jgi:hypothetical protein
MAGGQSRTDIPRRYLPPVVSGIAFLALLILIVVLAVNSLVQLNTSHRLDGMTQDHARRINVITRVQFAVNVCTESLLRMALTQDAVERAAYTQRSSARRSKSKAAAKNSGSSALATTSAPSSTHRARSSSNFKPRRMP